MPFKVANAQIDVVNKSAHVVAFDQTATHTKTIQIQFPFTPSPSEATEESHAIAAAKLVLQQALNEI